MSLRRSLGCWAGAACVALAAVVAAVPAGAIEPPPGSRNFTAPSAVPNYFSNESGPFQGGANARAAPSGAAPSLAAPVPARSVAVASRRHGRHHAAHAGKARGRFQVAQRRAIARGQVVHARAARVGKPSVRRVAQAHPGPARTKVVVVRAPHHPAPSKGKRLAGIRG